jgi:hypothetical protein
MRRSLKFLLLVISCAAVAAAQQSAPAKKRPAPKSPGPQALHLAPKLTPGQVLRYQIELRTITENRQEGLVQDPQGATQLEISWSATVRVEALASQDAAAAGRLRTTYERSAAAVRSESFDPAAALMEKQYRSLEGRSIEFTWTAEGKISDVKGLEDVVADEQAANAARQWVAQLVMGASLPAGGIVQGQHWTAERPADSAPLAGLVWRTDSSYLRNDACQPPAPAPAQKFPTQDAPSEACAVILTRLEMGQPHPVHDPTPEDYSKRGLLTSGTWRGSGQSLSYISLHSGWVVSSTQSGTEEMDITISNVSDHSSVHYAGKVRSQSQITLLPTVANPASP